MQHQLTRLVQPKQCGAQLAADVRSRHALICVCLSLAVMWLGFAGCGEPSAAARLRAGRGFTLLLPRDIQQFDPRFVSDAYGHKLSRLLFASLVRIEPETLEPVPDLAEKVELVSEVEYRATLRPGLRFSDGSALTSEDVVATYQSVVDPRLHTRYASSYQRIARVWAPDERTVVFQLSGPHASFLCDLELPILRAEDAMRRVDVDTAGSPAASGPYVLLARHPGSLSLGPNPHWYAGTPRVPYVSMLVVHDDNTRALRLLSGAADYTLGAVPPGLLPLFSRDTGFAVESATGIGTTFLGINMQVPGLSDVRVRKAIALAIDRRALIRAKYYGRAEPASSFVPKGHWAYAADTPSYDYDPAQARALLDAAGLTGEPRAHWVLRCGSERSRVSVVRAVAAMLADVGISVHVQPSETATLLTDLDRGHFELTLLQFPELIEPHVLSWVFASEHIPGDGREGLNRWRLRDVSIDRELEVGRLHSDRQTRQRAYRSVQHRLAELLPVVPLWHDAVVAVRTQAAPQLRVPRDGRFTQLAR